MSDLTWDEVRDVFAPGNPCPVPDGFVSGVSVADWRALLDLVRDQGWGLDVQHRREPAPVPERLETLFGARRLGVWVLNVTLPGGQRVRFWPVTPDPMQFEIHTLDFQGQERLDQLWAFLRALGRRLRRPVVLCDLTENVALYRYDVEGDRVVRLPAA